MAFLANRARMQLPSRRTTPARKSASGCSRSTGTLRAFSHAQLKTPAGQIARDYLARRQLTAQTVTRFGLGFAPDTWDSLVRAMKALGYSEQELFDGGLVRHGKSGGVYDTFRNRLMFPVIDVRGNVIGFSGRILGDGEPKYMNSPETIVFSKSHNLFALNLAKKSKCGYIILAEGNIDVASLHQAGFDSAGRLARHVAHAGAGAAAVALHGRDRHRLRQRRRGTEGVAARDRHPRKAGGARARAADAGRKRPDEYIKTFGADAFRNLLEQSENHIDYRLGAVQRKYDLQIDEQRVAFVKEAAGIVAELPGSVEREVYAHARRGDGGHARRRS